jgi:pyruvate dehydrogenase E2 component (dihydrolipoamide acetyltransferase)
MAVPVTVAKVGWGTEPISLVEWKSNEGDRVQQTGTVLVITTGKIESEVEAAASGYLHIVVPAGEKAEIGSTVGLIADSPEELAALQKEAPARPAASTATQPAPAAPAAAPAPAAPTETGRVIISPVARKMAEENMIDISTVTGTGPGGRIVREDIEKAIAAKASGKTAAAAPAAAYQGKKVKSVLPLRGMRGAIAENMHRSLATSAQLTLMGEIDAAELVKLRETLVGQEAKLGVRVTYTDIFVFVISRLLHDHPLVNSSIIGNEIKLWDDVNIGVAVALDDGLIVPVVRDAGKKSVIEISQSVKTLAEKARTGKLVPDDVAGGTFTITNLGALGGGYRFETVIINPPESAILGTGGISDRVVARSGQVVIRPVLTYYFTYDHRVITGSVAASFIGALTRVIENPYLLIDWQKAAL